MFFFLSKLLYPILTSPFIWALLLLVWRWRTKKELVRKRLLTAVIVMLLFFSNEWIFTQVAHWYQTPERELKVGEKYSCGILLGGMAGGDINNKGHFNSNSDRFIQTIKLYYQGHIDYILVSGGNSYKDNAYNEGAFVASQLAACGIPQNKILVENQSRNTHENGVFTKQLLAKHQLQPPYVLITSAVHMPRSLKVFEKAGFTQLIAYPANFLAAKQKPNVEYYLIPQVEVIHRWQRLFKEWVGILAYSLTGKA
ncbi:MAG TPA: hypothetical protein DCL43_00355 [Chitinophagaceae bacterium]|nr:hypothetical protein [Chitinophagaceae bacterium]